MKGENRVWAMQQLSRSLINSISDYWHQRNIKRLANESQIDLGIHIKEMKSTHYQLGEYIQELEKLNDQENTDKLY